MSFLFSRWPFFSHSWKETGQQAWDHWLSGPLSSPCRRNLALCPFPLSHRFKTTIPSDFWEDALFLLLTKSHQPADSFYSVFHRPGWIYNILLADGPTFVFGIPCLSLGPLFKYTPPLSWTSSSALANQKSPVRAIVVPSCVDVSSLWGGF